MIAEMRARDDGFTLIELLLVIAIIGIVASIAIPGLQRARGAANEASAIGSGRSLNEAQALFSSVCGAGAYSPDVVRLATDEYASPDMALPIKSGFTYVLGVSADGNQGPLDCNGDPTITAYYWRAAPVSSSTGRRAFATNQDGTIWVDLTGVPPAEPLGAGAETPLQ